MEIEMKIKSKDRKDVDVCVVHENIGRRPKYLCPNPNAALVNFTKKILAKHTFFS